MQSVAAEMRHAETAFLLRVGDGFGLRWFTPTTEVDLCGHATLASAHVLWETGRVNRDEPIRFQTRSGILTARFDQRIVLDFPSIGPSNAQLPHPVAGLQPLWTGTNQMDWFIEIASELELRHYQPDFTEIESLGLRGLIVTAASPHEFDFVSRFFAPQSGVPEDPVTGSAHCCLAPYWSGKLDKTKMIAHQASARGGVVGVELKGQRVELSGDAVTVLGGVLRC